MKASPKKLLPLTLFGIAVASLFSIQPAQAFTVTLEQVGANVVANGSGAINLTGLTPNATFSPESVIAANIGAIALGVSSVNVPGYTGFTGRTSFGSGNPFLADTSSGDFVGITSVSRFGRNIIVPQGYVSGTALSDSATFNNATFASLGVRQGTFVWSWGTGLPNQNFTLIIGSGVPTPDGGSTVSLLGCALLGLAALRRKLGC